MDSLVDLKNKIDEFVTERDWDQFHSPGNLAKSISIEANELLECFQWSDDNYDINAVKEELADVMTIKSFLEITGAANLVASIVEEELDGVGVLLGVLTLLIGVVLEEIGVLEDDELLLEDGSLLF